MTLDDINRVKELLYRAREQDPRFEVFGSKYHRYQFGPLLSEDELLAFESRHQIVLPADYRFFLANFGNGTAFHSSARSVGVNSGPGPGYGIFPLEESIEECDLSKPFPLVESLEVQPFAGSECWGDEEAYPGVLQISTSGCGAYDFLVVSGPAYGTVWGSFWVNNFSRTAPSFEAWFDDWVKWLTKSLPPEETS